MAAFDGRAIIRYGSSSLIPSYGALVLVSCENKILIVAADVHSFRYRATD